MAHGFHSYLKSDGKWLLTRVSNHPFGSFHKCGYPNSWMGYFMENPQHKKWMMTGDIPMSGQFDIFFQAERSLHDALAVLYQTVQVAGGTQAVRRAMTRCLKRHRYP